MFLKTITLDKGRLALFILFGIYTSWWIYGNRAMLFDPMFQNNDVRTHVYSFHKYAGNKAISNDPIANEVRNMMTTGIHGLYRIIVPLTNVQIAAKIVQGICFLII